MPLSTKLRADYVELINGELDHIFIERHEEFDLVAQKLLTFITPPPPPQKMGFFSTLKGLFSPASEKKPTVQPKFSALTQSHLDYVSYCYNNPQDFVKLSSDYAEYKKILRERIAAKITELRQFTDEERTAYIKFQLEKHKDASQLSLVSSR